uniref:F-box domain-containing protein n=1 Tax=Mycena chlorophos TaxID=658473 RepID=A0ABQ0LZY4_MYCCL|nr:predicted protein [Mycena chlorophos]
MSHLEKRVASGEHSDELAEDLRRHRAILSPIRELPAELVCTLLGLTLPVDDDPDGLRVPWRLGHVCRRWRQAALSYPALWSCIVVRAVASSLPERDFAPLHEQLLRAHAGPLSMTFLATLAEDNRFDPNTLSLLLPTSARWALLRFTGFRDRPKFPRNFWNDVNRALPRLTTLECMRSSELHLDLGSFFLDAQIPQLRVAKLYDTGFDDVSPPIQLPMNNITHYRGAYEAELHLDDARHLQVCVLGFHAPDAELAIDRTRVLLPCLTALYIEGVEFLDWLETPLLDHLSIFCDSDFLPRWDVSTILLFLRRPEYAHCLRSLALLSGNLTFASDGLRELLQELPRLEHLTLALAPEEQRTTTIITQLLNTNSSLAAQDSQGSGDATPLCPHLTSFKYGAAGRAEGDESHAEYLDLLLQLAQSRARRRLQQEPTLTDPAFVLYMYVAYSSEPFVVPRLWPTREQLAEEGLELVVMAGTDSRVQAEFWGDF